MRIAALFFAVTTLAAGSASATVIDFDTLPGGGALARGTDLTSQYSSLGVTFRAIEASATVPSVVSNEDYGGAWNVTSNIWTNCSSDDCSAGSRADALEILFAAPVSGVSWLTQSFGSLSVTFNAYDSGGGLLESVVRTGDLVATAFASGGIARIEALQPSDSWAWGLDDLTFTSAAVPEPGTLAVFAAALAGLGFARRKRA